MSHFGVLCDKLAAPSQLEFALLQQQLSIAGDPGGALTGHLGQVLKSCVGNSLCMQNVHPSVILPFAEHSKSRNRALGFSPRVVVVCSFCEWCGSMKGPLKCP